MALSESHQPTHGTLVGMGARIPGRGAGCRLDAFAVQFQIKISARTTPIFKGLPDNSQGWVMYLVNMY